MSNFSLRVENSPFNQEQADLLARVLPTLTPVQAAWLSGFLAASAAGQGTDGHAASGDHVPLAAGGSRRAEGTGAEEVQVLYASQTGNAQHLAEDLARRLREAGHTTALASMSDFNPRNLKKIKTLFVVASTQGNGDPPDGAVPFCEFLLSHRAPKLDGVRFSVLGLGDLTYEKFCQTGKNFDKRFEELGGVRLVPRSDCDVDFDEPAAAWMDAVLAAVGTAGGTAEAEKSNSQRLPILRMASGAPAGSPRTSYSRSLPYHAEVIENLNLNGRGSDKETRHLKLSIEGSGLSFEPGDSLGIYPTNDPALVDQIIEYMGWRAEERVPVGKTEHTLREALLRHFEVTILTKPLLEQTAQFSHDGLRTLVREGCEEKLRAYLPGRDLLDLVRDFSLHGVGARDFTAVLRKLPARLYSIASSYRANPDEVDLTIAALRYEAHDRQRLGTCSVHCAERVQPGDTLPVYVHSNPNFRLPADPTTAMIMIGPGTGVAPFRAFIEERVEVGAEGRSWLFFGARRFRTDFLYQIEWQRWLKEGALTRMDVAFSRDTDQKVYVQHRMLENSRDLWVWLEDGAYLYVCGDEQQMANDVHAALETIVQREGDLRPEAAAQYLADLRREGRYQRDVY